MRSENATSNNWAGNLTYSRAEIVAPQIASDLSDTIKSAVQIHAVGTRHSFNEIADTVGTQISLAQFSEIGTVDPSTHTVSVGAGVTYAKLDPVLESQGYALANLASLPHISVVGATSTGTHGSGERNRNLSAAVEALEIITSSGETIHFNRTPDDSEFNGAVVSLGALGVITSQQLKVLPTFEVEQRVYENLPWTSVTDSFDAIQQSAYSVSLFHDWRTDQVNQVWLKSKVGDGKPTPPVTDLFGATAAVSQLHPLPDGPAGYCTEQLGVAGPWHERLTHFKSEFTPSHGEELQSEYFVPRLSISPALEALRSIQHLIAPNLYISEIRTIAADELWLSPCYMQDSVGIHFTWLPKVTNVMSLLPLIEERLSPFGAKPHWGKLFTMAPSRIRDLYPRFSDFAKLVEKYDPTRKFRNAYLERLLG